MGGVLEFAFAVLAIGAALPYLLGPVLVRLRQREPADPVFEPYDEGSDPVVPDLAAALGSSVRALEAEGLRRVADLFHAHRTTGTLLRLVLLEHPETGAVAVVVAARGTDPRATARFTFVEFAVRFTDQRTFSVQNSPQQGVYAPHPSKLTEWLPQVRDPARLWRVFRQQLGRRYGSIARQRVDVGDPAGLMAAALLREYRQQVETGHLWFDASADAFRPTWRGAWLMTWKLLPPMSQVRRWRARRQGDRLLRELNLAAPDPRPVPVEALRDPMRWNFALLVGALVLLWLTRSTDGLTWPRSGRVALPPGFVVPPDFVGAVRALERLAGDTATPLLGIDTLGAEPPTGAFAVRVPGPRAEGILRLAHEIFLAQGFYLFLAERNYGIGDAPDRLALFPGRDPYAILPLVGTNAWNYGFGPDSIVRWLRALERDQPFVLTGIAFDWVEGRFTDGIRDPEALARRFYAFCPDVVEQGTGTVRALARELRTTRVLYCWWD